jgi:Tol biopolymer transport system component
VDVVSLRPRKGATMLVGVVLVAMAMAGGAQAGISRFVAGGTADSSYGIYPSDVSSDGRFLLWVQDGDGVVEADMNGALDLYVRDRVSGETEGIGVNEAGELVGANGGTISADGRLVAFAAGDGILGSDGNGLVDVFLRDRQSGSTVLVSRAADGGAANGQVDGAPQISADGRFIAYESQASNLVAGDSNDTGDVFLYDVHAGTTTLVSAGRSGGSARGWSSAPSISANGHYVAFFSFAWDVDAKLNTFGGQVFVYDHRAGTRSVVSVDDWGVPGSYGASFGPAISADGTMIAFASVSSTLVPGDTNEQVDVFVHDRAVGTTRRVSVPRGAATSGEQANGRSDEPQISGDGSIVTFRSDAGNLVPGDGNDVSDAYAVNLVSGAIARLSSTADGSAGNGWTQAPLLAADGSLAIFSTSATNLTADGVAGTFIVSPLTFGTPPTIEVPEGLTIEATSPYGSPLAYDVTANDAEDGQVPVNCTPGQGGEHPLGQLEVSCTATDSEGLTTSVSFMVSFVDTTAPVMQLVDINAAPNGPDGTRMGWDTHPTDNADWYPDVVCVPESFSDFVFPIGDTTVTCTATDDSGNSSSGSFIVHVLSVAELLRQAQAYLVEIDLEPTLRRSLAAELEAAARAADRDNDSATCSAIGDYQDHIRAQAGKKVSSDTAEALLANAEGIRTIVPCS